MNKQLASRVKEAFVDRFGAKNPTMIFSPGRINLIGEHTDYNDGYVLPAAVAQGIYMAVAPSHDQWIRLTALDLEDTFEVSIEQVSRLEPNGWPNYLLGVVAEMKKIGARLGGFNAVFAGDIPIGSGMSSSAALENATSFALCEIFDLKLERVELLKISQKAEHNYAGVQCGIMDQFASMMGKQHQALLLDCRTLDYQYFSFDLGENAFVLINSNVTHDLATSAYNERRMQCEMGVKALQAKFSDIKALRDATIEQLDSVKTGIDSVVYLRCKYIIEENIRVKAMTAALSAGDLVGAGQILRQAQKGMSTEYKISCDEIDFLADFANAYDGVLGARMMGGGFGGCTINLIKKEALKEFYKEISSAYTARFGLKSTLIPIEIADGTHVLNV